MEKKIATVISYLTHPLIVPMLGLLVISNSGTYAAEMDPLFIEHIYMRVFMLTFMMPIAFIPIYYYFRLVSNMRLDERRERIIPYYITLICYILAYFMITKLPVSQVYQRMLFAASLSLLIVTGISHFWKVSTHMTGWGGLIALILGFSIRFNTDLMIFLIIAIFIAGAVACARLMLNAHNPLQVLTGFVIGFCTMLAVFLI
jgi:membrane-associated phospholipid phosphatase